MGGFPAGGAIQLLLPNTTTSFQIQEAANLSKIQSEEGSGLQDNDDDKDKDSNDHATGAGAVDEEEFSSKIIMGEETPPASKKPPRHSILRVSTSDVKQQQRIVNTDQKPKPFRNSVVVSI